MCFGHEVTRCYPQRREKQTWVCFVRLQVAICPIILCWPKVCIGKSNERALNRSSLFQITSAVLLQLLKWGCEWRRRMQGLLEDLNSEFERKYWSQWWIKKQQAARIRLLNFFIDRSEWIKHDIVQVVSELAGSMYPGPNRHPVDPRSVS